MQFSEHIARHMKLRDLHILMAVARAGSMNKAAVILNMTQSAVSRSIAELERAVGVGLLDRNARGVEPTTYGRALLDGGTAVFDDLHQAVKYIEYLADPAVGEVRIGSGTNHAATFVSAVIEQLSRHYPRIVFHLVTVTEVDTLHHELSERKLDLLITRRLELFTREKFDFENLCDDSPVVAAGVQSPWVRRRRIALTELANETWLLPPPERTLGPICLEAFRACGLDYPRTAVFTTDSAVRISLVATGRFLTIVPSSTLSFSKRPDVKVLPIELQHARVPIGIVTLKHRKLSPVAKLFIETAREVVKPLAKAR